ncbi:hypothetical protein HRR83_000452 [Exophiala dermatitidis]|uniref:amidase n=2 Tax=Exophiala dermatitidis TaxID=5970 RepID=H6C9B2_EXODN|nr:amidase [Exophiala dermatitidis NIH/UT8656]KAJ4527699.1 hypothetical protein HRR74_000454 [Exophiala dermatitidis]EHY60683.1 amidase [Exophiala dermatitidis NIH/UT8656]KAJ4528335.1 hypothetical protein HRR73_000958 [Exophiala dermatitidis]KAJ4581516.1 hypothetical protein HRR79_000543 [Exophiala dermatitidis]KAJ4584737.1 hypothetical protein HRR81_000543 [Exophiala dermatitidis]
MAISPPAEWESIAAAKRAALMKSIPPEWLVPAEVLPSKSQLDVTSFPESSGWFTPEELKITSSTSEEILERIRDKTWSAKAVTSAFCKRAAAAHQLTNCLSETMFPEALAAAEALDEAFSRTGAVVGPLHGLPISIKDNFNVVGKDSTVGFVSWCNKPHKQNSVLVDLLKSLGAVIYVKTNVPTAMMMAETVNNTFGRTLNPLRLTTTPGGSSGGESALLAFHGSPLGVGTDIGGSLRIPASCTGIFTLRPSLGRFPTAGCTSGLAGQESVNSVNGPMGPTLSDLKLFAKSVVDSKPWLKDPKALPIPWRDVQLPKKLKFGVIWNDRQVTPTPPVQRALKTTVEKLRKAGHEVVDWDSSSHPQALNILSRFFVADGGKSCRKALEPVGEPFHPQMKAYEEATEMGCYDLWQLHLERNKLCQEYIDRWAEAGIDGILSPTTPFSTVEHEKYKHVAYTAIWNILDYSAVNFPSGVAVDKNQDTVPADFSPLSELDKEINSEYNPAAVDGMPVGLQIIGRRLEEEKTLEMTGAILDALKA